MATPADEPAAPAASPSPTPADDGFSDIPVDTPPAADKPKEGDQPKADEGKQPPEGAKDPKDADKPLDDKAEQHRKNAEAAKRRVEERERNKQPTDAPADGREPANPDQPDPDDKPADNADGETPSPDEFLSKLENDIAEELGKIEDEQERRVQAIEARQYLSEAKTATNQLILDHSRVQADIPIFNPESPDFNKEAYEYFVTQYQASQTTTDRNGVIWPKSSLYQFMKGASDLLSGVSQKSALKGQQDEAKMRGRAEVPSGMGNRGKSDEDDPFLKGFLGK